MQTAIGVLEIKECCGLLSISWRRHLSYRNQSIDLQSCSNCSNLKELKRGISFLSDFFKPNKSLFRNGFKYINICLDIQRLWTEELVYTLAWNSVFQGDLSLYATGVMLNNFKGSWNSPSVIRNAVGYDT